MKEINIGKHILVILMCSILASIPIIIMFCFLNPIVAVSISSVWIFFIALGTEIRYN